MAFNHRGDMFIMSNRLIFIFDAFAQECFLSRESEVRAVAGPTWDLNSQPYDFWLRLAQLLARSALKKVYVGCKASRPET